ncbi:transporter substrate-binding domain-containing protein [Defluviitalea phaphyphila]|uniref:transporter substrate-binding domain-containing protein n=1 Tax=Defluviitalea phaphyphila TaxID=1473580 RepID=UPI0007318C5E|nr:transporter substrate-binding domain-containing protein [Defluviitalea phaphyphila]
MKKILSLLAIIIILLSGCSSNSKDILRVGMDLKYFPFTGMDEQGNPVGVEVDIAKALGEYLGKEVQIVNTEFSMLIPALQSEEVDIIIGSMSITEEREKTVDFSNPYLYQKIVALVNKDFAKKHGINDEMSVEELFSIKDTRFIGITGSISAEIPQSYGFEVREVTTDAVAEREIATGSADILVGSYTLYGKYANNKETTIIYKNPIEISEVGMAVKQGNTELLKQVNEFISQMESSGLNDKLRKDWDAEIAKKMFDETKTLDYYLKKN